MPKFGPASKRNLAGAHPLLQKLFNAVIADFDCTVLDGQRNRADQEKAFALGHSRAHFGQSAHNWQPSVAVDVVPYPLNWSDTRAFQALAHVAMQKAKDLGIDVTWGGSWTSIKDMPHYELTNWREKVKDGEVKPYTGN